MHTALGIGSSFASPLAPNPWTVSPFGAPSVSQFGSPLQAGGQQQSLLQWLQIVPQQIQQLQQVVQVQQQQLQQLLQIVPAQLQQVQQVIQLLPYQLQQ